MLQNALNMFRVITHLIHSQGQGCKMRILSGPETVGDTEVYDLEFDAEGVLDSEPHRSGCMESLTVLNGRLRVTSDGEPELVQKGDTIRYVADCTHSIHAESKGVRALLIVTGS